MNKNEPSFWKKHLAQAQFELLVAAYTKCTVDWQDDVHIPDFNRLYYITKGEGRITLAGKSYFPRPHQIVLMPSGISQSYSIINGNPYEKYWCHFTSRIHHISLFDIIKVPVIIDVKEISTVENTFERLIDGYRCSDWTSFFDMQAALIKLISLCINELDSTQIELNTSPQSIPRLEKINQIIRYIDHHLSSPIQLKELAERVHYHPTHFSRVFKELTGYSPMNYVNIRRMEWGKELLMKSDYSISQIAEQIGMDIYYFSKRFKEMNGFSPSNFRRIVK